MYAKEEYFEYESDEFEEDDIYKTIKRSLLLEDDEINEYEDGFMVGYEQSQEDCGCMKGNCNSD